MFEHRVVDISVPDVWGLGVGVVRGADEDGTDTTQTGAFAPTHEDFIVCFILYFNVCDLINVLCGAVVVLLGRVELRRLAIRSWEPFESLFPSDPYYSISRPHPHTPHTHTQFFLDPDAVSERIQTVVRNFDKVDSSKVTPTSSFSDDLGLDSLDAVEVVMAIEDEFVIEIPDAEADKILSIEDAVKYIASHPQAK